MNVPRGQGSGTPTQLQALVLVQPLLTAPGRVPQFQDLRDIS